MPISKHTEQVLLAGLHCLAHGQISGVEVNAEATQNRAERRLLEYMVQIQQLLHDVIVQCETLGRSAQEPKLEVHAPGDEVHAALTRLAQRVQELTQNLQRRSTNSMAAARSLDSGRSGSMARVELPHSGRPILIIEADSEVASQLLTRAREHGRTAVVTNHGLEGLRLADTLQPRLILLGLELPDSEGRKILEQLKFNLSTRPIPVYAILSEFPAPQLLEMGAVGHVSRHDSAEQNAFFTKLVAGENSQRRMLVVEDNRLTQRIIRRLIARERVELEVVGTGAEALSAVGQRHFDCLLLDLDLPDMSGFEFLKRLALLEVEQRPPVVVYTGTELTQGQRRELSLHAAGIVLKGPESPERLLDAVALYLHCSADELPASQRAALHALHDPKKLLQGRTVLVVDDDADLSMDSLSELLVGAGMSVLRSRSAADALEKLAVYPDVAVALIDLGLPAVDGLETTRQIRNIPRYADLPIIAVTSNPLRYDRERCLLAGANDFMTKPVGPDQLLALLRMWLYRAA